MCTWSNLDNAVDPNLRFIDYVYYFRILVYHLQEHLKSLAKHIVNRFEITSNDLVIDIACNDGTLLSFFSDYGVQKY